MPKTLSRVLLPAVLALAPVAAHAGEVHVTTPAAPLAVGATTEQVSLSTALAPAIGAVPVGGRLRLLDWPIGPGRRGTAELTRHDVYAPDARLYVVDDQGVREVARSTWLFFRGEAADAAGRHWTLAIAFDPERRTVEALSWDGDLRFELTPASGRPGQHVVKVAADPAFARCDQGDAQAPLALPGLDLDSVDHLHPIAAPDTTAGAGSNAITTLHTASVAVDLDNEAMLSKFSDNTTTAGNFLASLFNSMNAMYERDLLVRLVQGTTFYRVSSTADPYTQAATATTFAKLQELTNYWSANNGGISRAVTMMLSRRTTATGSSWSGIAWVDALCSTGFGYSFTQTGSNSTSVQFGDTLVIGHEVGHNFGSPHTHCYTPPVDQCYNAESGCYAGGTSCPLPTTMGGIPNVTGTLMSYCHLSGLSGCSSSLVFHPTTVALLQPKIQSAVGTCIFPLAPPNSLFANGFESGGLVWSAHQP